MTHEFHPPKLDRQIRKTAEESFGETVCRQAVRQTTDPARWEAALRREHADRTGERGLSPKDLVVLGFPVPVFAERIPLCAPGQLLGGFEKSALYERWVRLEESFPSGGGHRALVFNWIGWGVCVLTDAEWAETVPARFSIKTESEEEFVLCRWELFVKNSGWSAVG